MERKKTKDCLLVLHETRHLERSRKCCWYVRTSEVCCLSFLTLQEDCLCEMHHLSASVFWLDKRGPNRSLFEIKITQIYFPKKLRLHLFLYLFLTEAWKWVRISKIGRGRTGINIKSFGWPFDVFLLASLGYAQFHKQQDFKLNKEQYFGYAECSSGVKACFCLCEALCFHVCHCSWLHDISDQWTWFFFPETSV